VRSHFLHLLLYGTLVAVFFAVLARRRLTEQLRLGALLFVGMVGGALALAYLMFPFPR
jgi:amino acid permease